MIEKYPILGAVVALLVFPVLVLLFRLARDPKTLSRILSSRHEDDFIEVLRRRFDSSVYDLTLAEEVWRRIADCDGVRPGYLRLEDRFDRELAVKPAFYDDENSCVNVFVSAFAKKRGIRPDYSKMITLEDCLTALCRWQHEKVLG